MSATFCGRQYVNKWQLFRDYPKFGHMWDVIEAGASTPHEVECAIYRKKMARLNKRKKGGKKWPG